MGLSGTTDSSVYEGLRDVLKRHPVTTNVVYEPDSIVKQYLRADVDPDRVVPQTGPESPALDVEWRFLDGEPYYRIHYADPNTGFNCGWHRDDDHPELGPTHFQYEIPQSGGDGHERARFSKTVPTEILWTALDRLFGRRIPNLITEA